MARFPNSRDATRHTDSDHDDPNHPKQYNRRESVRAGLWFAIRPINRPSGPRAACVLRDCSAQHHSRAGPRVSTFGVDLFRRPRECLRRGGPSVRSRAVRPGYSHPGYLLRNAACLSCPRG